MDDDEAKAKAEAEEAQVEAEAKAKIEAAEAIAKARTKAKAEAESRAAARRKLMMKQKRKPSSVTSQKTRRRRRNQRQDRLPGLACNNNENRDLHLIPAIGRHLKSSNHQGRPSSFNSNSEHAETCAEVETGMRMIRSISVRPDKREMQAGSETTSTNIPSSREL